MDWLFEKTNKSTETEKLSININKYRLLILGILSLAILSWSIPLLSCQISGTSDTSDVISIPEVNLDGPINIINDQSGKAGDIAEDIKNSTDSIDQHADNIKINTPKDILPKVEPDFAGIKQDTNDLRGARNDILLLKSKLEGAESDLKKQGVNALKNSDRADKILAEKKQLEKELQKQQEENAQLFKKMLAWMGVVCVAGLGVSAALAFFFRGILPLMIGVGFAVTLSVCIVLSLYMQVIAWIAIGIAAFAVVGASFVLWKFQHSEKKADEELVRTGEVLKSYMPEDVKNHVFGNGPEGGVIDKIQSKYTKSIVKDIRSKNQDPNTKKFENAPLDTILSVPLRKVEDETSAQTIKNIQASVVIPHN